MHRITLFLSFLLLIKASSTAQVTRKVLFLGNSYTAYNNLPQLVKDAAQSAGDTLIVDSYTPGGYTLEDHSLDPATATKIMAGGWDFVSLQGQSREPILQYFKFRQGARQLTTQLLQHSPCAVPLLYMTWGRKNGDAGYCPVYPEMCTYSSMDSALREQYLKVAEYIDGAISPVSAVWRNLRQNHPSIELYHPDGSHPSAAGSYAAACSFYAAIFQKDPTAITFNYTLNATDAAAIRNAAKTEVYDSLSKWDYQKLPHSEIQYNLGSGTNEVMFNPVTLGISQNYLWDFGDGATSTLINPTHSYAANGTYTITLTTTKCNLQGMHSSVSDTTIQFCAHTPSVTITKPWLCNYDTLWTQAADAYQWYSGGTPLPETQQFLPNYQRYNSFGFSVRTTVNGCSEVSQVYYANPEWSGYYFDAVAGGDPCEGDTAIISVLRSVAFSGSEIIRWYKNGSLLPAFNDQDTLWVTTGGKYVCEVINPDSDCPLDTTSSGILEYDCGDSVTVGIAELEENRYFRVYPNPASEILTIEWPDASAREEIHMYSATGRLIRKATVKGTLQLRISDLPNGLYFLLSPTHPRAVEKFIKQ